MLIKELLALNEAMLAKEKKGLADEAAKLMKVSPSEILDITNMWTPLTGIARPSTQPKLVTRN
jgi:hypothetical protein